MVTSQRSVSMTHPLADYLEIEGEDDLTKMVFGILELIDDDLIRGILDEAEIEIEGTIAYAYHTKIDPGARRTPDVLIELEDGIVMVEVKRGRSLNPEQLLEQSDDLDQFADGNAELLLVSGHDERPAELDRDPLTHVRWMGWRDIAIRVSAFEMQGLDATQRELLRMLQDKFESEGYVPFTGIDATVLAALENVTPTLEDFYNEINMFLRDVERRVDDRGLQAKNLWRNGISQDFHVFPSARRFITDHLWIAFGTHGTEIPAKHGSYYFFAFAWPEGSSPTIRVGYSLSPGRSGPDRKWLVTHASEIAAFVDESSFSLHRASWQFRTREAFVDAAEVTPLLSDQETLQAFERIQIATEYGVDQLADPYVTDEVAHDLARIYERVSELEGVDTENAT